MAELGSTDTFSAAFAYQSRKSNTRLTNKCMYISRCLTALIQFLPGLFEQLMGE